MIKVSVIIPIFNSEKYIERCAKSLFEQTLNDIEYIFIDDGSTDNSIKILKNTINKYPNRIKDTQIIQLKTNHGIGYIRKIGASISKGEYIIYCDSDDWLELNAYQILYEQAIDKNDDIVFYNWKTTDGTKILQEIHRNVYDDKIRFIKEILNGNEMGSVCFALCKRYLYENDIIDTEHSMIEDSVLMIQLIYYAKSYRLINKSLYFYFINPNSASRKKGEKECIKRYNEIIENIKKILLFIDNIGYTNTLFNEIIILKYWARLQLGPITHIKQYYNLWKNTYPEIDHGFLFNRYIPLRFKLNYLLVKTHFYKYIKKII